MLDETIVTILFKDLCVENANGTNRRSISIQKNERHLEDLKGKNQLLLSFYATLKYLWANQAILRNSRIL